MSFERVLIAHPSPGLLDEDGRAVAEVGAEIVGAPTELVACPYADRRAGRPMNRSALRQMSGVWPGVLERVRAFAGPGPVTVRGALHAVLTGVSWTVHHHHHHPEEPVPRLVAVTYKTCLGLSQVLGTLCLADRDVGDAALGSLGDGDAFFGFLDDGDWLLGQVEVCAGPRPMFVDVFDALREGGGTAPDWSPRAVRAITLAAAALLAASPDPTSSPTLSRLAGPKGPSWSRAVLGVAGRSPPDAAWWLAEGDPRREEVERFGRGLAGLPADAVERRLLEALDA